MMSLLIQQKVLINVFIAFIALELYAKKSHNIDNPNDVSLLMS